MSVELFYTVLAVCAVVLTGVLVWTCVRLTRTLANLDSILTEVKGVFSEIEIFKSGLKMGLVSLISALVTKLRLPEGKSRGVKGSE